MCATSTQYYVAYKLIEGADAAKKAAIAELCAAACRGRASCPAARGRTLRV
jgi:hypothetical protein